MIKKLLKKILKKFQRYDPETLEMLRNFLNRKDEN